MIISKTPLRMSFVGGGSDMADFYVKHPGAVLATTINKYIYVTVNKRFDSSIRVSYSKTENVEKLDEIQHKLVREAMRYTGIIQGVEITSIADIPSHGSGLGSSSAFTAGLLKSLHTYNNRSTSALELAKEAAKIEIEILSEPIGKQDHYACAYGGFNFIQFFPDHTVKVDPVILSQDTLQKLKNNILVFFTGITRSASEILKQQKVNLITDGEKIKALKQMVKLAHQLKNDLEKNNLDSFGPILHENWMLKKQLSHNISNGQINDWYEKARKAGAEGGKILGAGGGGFLLFYAPQERHGAIQQALLPLKPFDLDFESEGSRIIFIH